MMLDNPYQDPNFPSTNQGDVWVDWKTMTINVRVERRNDVYDIPFDRCQTPSDILDWIFQLAHKNWMTPGQMMRFMACLDAACDKKFGRGVQGTFCPWGNPICVDWKTGTKVYSEYRKHRKGKK